MRKKFCANHCTTAHSTRIYFPAGECAFPGNLAGHMIGNLLTLLTVGAGFSFLVVSVLQDTLARRSRVPIRISDRATDSISDPDAR